MKKLSLLLFLCCLFLVPKEILADGTVKARRRCYVGHKRYVAVAKIKEYGSGWSNDNEKKSSGTAVGHISMQDYDCWNNYVVAAEAYGKASLGYSEHWSYEGDCVNWNAGYSGLSVNVYDIRFSPKNLKKSGSWGSRAGLEIDTIDWDSSENKITVHIAGGQLRIYQTSNNDYYVAIAIKLQDLSNDLDDETGGTVYEDARIIWKEGAILNSTHFNGNYSQTSSGSDIIYEIDEFDLVFDLDNYPGIADWNNVEVQVISDGGVTSEGIPSFLDLPGSLPSNVLKYSDENLGINIYPTVLTSGQSMNVELISNSKLFTHCVVAVYTPSGQLVYNEKFMIRRKQFTLPGNIFSSSGLYLINIETDEGNYKRRILVRD